MAIEVWIEEFLYRGRPPTGPGSETPPTFQVTIGQQATNPFDANAAPARQVLGPMAPEVAEAAGYDLPTILEALNTDAIAALNTATTERDQLATELDAAQEQIAALQARISGAGG